MSLDTDMYKKIRHLYSVKKFSQRQIARILNVGRNTVRKYCEGATTPEYRNKCAPVTNELTEKVTTEIIRLIEENKNNPKKQRLSAKNIWYILRKSGYDVGESTIRRYVHKLKNKNPNVFIPLDFDPAEVVEIDWGDVTVYMSGKKITVSIFCAILPFSNAPFIGVFPDKTFISFLTGHVMAFEFFGGVPRKCIYDNLKSAVLSGSGSTAIKQEQFKKLEAHYAFEAVFCNRAAGWEKGATENLVSIARKIAFVPILHVDNFKQLQDIVTSKCIEYCEMHKIRGRKKTIKEMLNEERNYLTPLPLKVIQPANAFIAKVNTDLTVWNNGTKYSVPCELANKQVTLMVSPFDVDIYYMGDHYYSHKKAPQKGDHQYIPEHYLNIIISKPRSIYNALPLRKGIMPVELQNFMKLNKSKNKNEDLIKILLLGREMPKENLLWAVRQATESGVFTYEMVCFYLDITKQDQFDVEPFIESNVKIVDLNDYDGLIENINSGGINND
jgi:transposase